MKNNSRYFILLLLLLPYGVFSQVIRGSVVDELGNPLPFSSIFIKGTSLGVTANNDGKFQLILTPGSYTIVAQHVGYTKEERKISVNKDLDINFSLTRQRLQLKEVIVKTGDEDPAYEIIRQAIKKRPFYSKQVKAFECEAYIKGLVKLRNLPERILGQKMPEQDRRSMHLDSSGKGIIFLSESVTKVSMQQPDKFKLEVISGRQSGSNGFGFNFPTFISLYQDNVTMFASQLNPRGFISPIADNALNYYRYKYLGSFFEDGKEINSIRVIPTRNYDPVFSGTINITEGDWRIHSCDLLLTKTSQLEIFDSLQLTQIHVPVTKDVWRVKDQLVHFNFKQFGIDAVGNFVNVYSKYNINPKFPKNFFDRVVIKYDTSVNKKTKEYWDSIRPVPLEPEEVKDYKIKDSIYQYEKDSVYSKRNIDSLKKLQGHVKLKQLVWDGINRVHYDSAGNYSWHLDALLKSLQYNTVEGLVINPVGNFFKYLKAWKTNLTITPDIRYGFSNHEFNGSLDINFRTRDLGLDKKLKRETWDFSGGTRFSQFNNESNISILGNSVSSIIFGHNNLKIYKNIFGNVNYSKRFESGFRIAVDALYEDRIPVENTTDFVIISKNKSRFTPNYPFMNGPAFVRHQAVIGSLELSFKPGQRYIQFPKSKIAIGSKYPTFTFDFSHGFNTILGSDVDFDKWKFTVTDDMNLKLAGAIKYKISIAGFLNDKMVPIRDYQFFNGNESHFSKVYMNTFQLLNYYSAYTTAPLYGILNFEHHLNGMITNRIPLFKRLNWNMLYGSNDFFINGSNHYEEFFLGLENIFKVLRFDVVAGSRNGGKFIVDYRVGYGGLIGSTLSSRFRGRR